MFMGVISRWGTKLLMTHVLWESYDAISYSLTLGEFEKELIGEEVKEWNYNNGYRW